MTITFKPLDESHFSLLLKWLETPHVKKWWPVTPKLGTSEGGDQDVAYRLELVREKYSSYVKGYKLEGGVQKHIEGFIIHNNKNPIGYIQLYNAYDFPRSSLLSNLPESLGAIDFFIGEEDVLGKGLATEALKAFLENYAFKNYRYILADPEFRNEAAVRTYEKAGFKIYKRLGKEFWMIAHKQIVRLSIRDMIETEVAFKQNFLPEDRLWLFGSRADLKRKGGDIDLYIETYAEDVNIAVKMKSKFLSKLEEKIGEQKIDIVLNMMNKPYPLPIHEVAKTKGVRIL